MCNDYRYRLPIERVIEEFSQNKLPLFLPQGPPNLEPRDDIRIKDRAPIVRLRDGVAELSQMTWSWPAPTGKPVFNFRSDGRRFAPEDRVLVLADGFYEFTVPADPKVKLKDKHLFTVPGHELFAIAGIVKQGAFAMLTTEPGPDLAPYHDRQVVVLTPPQWRPWLEASVPEGDLLKSLPAGGFKVETVRSAG